MASGWFHFWWAFIFISGIGHGTDYPMSGDFSPLLMILRSTKSSLLSNNSPLFHGLVRGDRGKSSPGKWLVASGWWLGKPKRGTNQKGGQVRRGRSALQPVGTRSRAIRRGASNEGLITNGRGVDDWSFWALAQPCPPSGKRIDGRPPLKRSGKTLTLSLRSAGNLISVRPTVQSQVPESVVDI